MQEDNNEMTPIKITKSSLLNSNINDEGSNSIQNNAYSTNNAAQINSIGISSIQTSNIQHASNNKYSQINQSSIYKQLDNQSDTIFCPINDPIFQPTPSPNIFMDYKSSNPYFNSQFNANSMLASTKKPYNNNLFLTPIKEDDRRKPYINSILKESPYFNGNNICRKLNFDDDFDDFSGNSFMPGAGIFEEKKGVFSNLNMNFLLMPSLPYYPAFYNQQFDFHNANINNMDFQSMNMNKAYLTPSLNVSPENRKQNNGHIEESLQNMRQPDLDGHSKKSDNAPSSAQREIIQSKNNTKNNRIISASNLDFTQNSHSSAPTNNIFSAQQNSKKINNGNNNSIIISHQVNATNSVVATVNASNNASAAQTSNSNINGSSSIANNSNSKKQKTCNCKKTKCLKLYCDCFAGGELCGQECNCFGCFNTSNSEKRAGAIVSIMDRQPDAFGPKVQSNAHKKGCNCTRSGCLKKYCECFTLGVNCGEYCKCTQCKNMPNHSHNPPGSSPHQSLSHAIQTKNFANNNIHHQHQLLDQLESKTSSKKKIFITSSSSSNQLLKNQSTSNEDEEDGNHQELSQQEIDKLYKNNHLINRNPNIQEEEEDEEDYENERGQNMDEEDDDENDQCEGEQISPSLKMYTTPLKQPTNGNASRLTTADTANKQNHLLQDHDSEIKNRIVKLKITDTVSQKKKTKKNSKQSINTDELRIHTIQQEQVQQN